MNENAKQETKHTYKISCLGCFLIVILLCITSVAIIIGSFIYVTGYKETLLVESDSPNKTNTLTVVEVGEPAFFGPSSIRIKHKNGRFETSISNDGKSLDLTNVTVDWINDEEAMITLYGEEQSPEVIRFKDGGRGVAPFEVAYVELEYETIYAARNPANHDMLEIRAIAYSKGSLQHFNGVEPIRVYYGQQDDELEDYEEWAISMLEPSDTFEVYWNEGRVFIDVLGEQDNGNTYVKDSLEILIE